MGTRSCGFFVAVGAQTTCLRGAEQLRLPLPAGFRRPEDTRRLCSRQGRWVGVKRVSSQGMMVNGGQRKMVAGIGCVMVLSLMRLGAYLFGGESVDTNEAVQLRIQAENDLLRSELRSLPNDELWLRVEHQVSRCENGDPNDAGCNVFLRAIGTIKSRKGKQWPIKNRSEAEQELVKLHHYQLSKHTAGAHGAKKREVYRAGPVESFKAVAHTFGR